MSLSRSDGQNTSGTGITEKELTAAWDPPTSNQVLANLRRPW